MGTKKKRSVADVGHLAPFFLGEVHLVGTNLLDVVEVAVEEEEADEQQLLGGLQEIGHGGTQRHGVTVTEPSN